MEAPADNDRQHETETGAEFLGLLQHPVLRAVFPVLSTYVLAVIGLRSSLADDFEWQMQGDSLPVKCWMVLLFTVTHAVIPVFMYRIFTSAPLIRYFAYLHMGFWFGVPIALLASQTAWLSLAAPIVNVAMARKGTRAWVFLQYGSTSFALLLFLCMFHREAMFPAGMVVVLGQAMMLVVLELWGRSWWVTAGRVKSSPTAEVVRAFLSHDPPRRVPVHYRRPKLDQMLLYVVGAMFGGFGIFAMPLFAMDDGWASGAFVGLFGVVGCSILFFTWRHHHRLLKMLRTGIRVQAAVEEIQRTDMTVNGHRRHRVMVRFETQGAARVGSYYAYGADVAMARAYRESGERITILFDPTNPQRTLPAEPGARWTELSS